jgi:hypothetical protein
MKAFRSTTNNPLRVDSKIQGEWVETSGVWPLVDENNNSTEFVAIGNKDGVPVATLFALKKEYGSSLKYIYTCMNAPYMVSNFKFIQDNFDGIFDLDYRLKGLRCSHTMMVRSMPYQGNFWNYNGESKIYDFSMLTWSKKNDKCKRWDRGLKVCEYLCSKGLKGIVFNQRGLAYELLSDKLKPYLKTNLLRIYGVTQEFQTIMNRSKYSIFPNTLDAFPKIIVESLLGNRSILISTDLFQGRSVLSDLTCVNTINFNEEDYLDRIYNIVSKQYIGESPREAWLSRYSFDKLSNIWAKEFNRVFGTQYKKLFFRNHLDRIAHE